MAVGAVMAFWAVSLVFVLTPGADWAYAISAGLGHRSTVPAIGGLLAGHLFATLVVAAGVAALIARSAMVLTVLTVAGAAYLVWLGAAMLRHPAAPQVTGGPQDGPWGRRAMKGFGISGLNPKVFLLFVALLPQFTDPEGGWPVAAQIVLLGLVHVATCAVVYAGVSSGARVLLRARPTAAAVAGRISGIVMIGLGLLLGTEQLIGWLAGS